MNSQPTPGMVPRSWTRATSVPGKIRTQRLKHPDASSLRLSAGTTIGEGLVPHNHEGRMTSSDAARVNAVLRALV